jgi:hypothetical protein
VGLPGPAHVPFAAPAWLAAAYPFALTEQQVAANFAAALPDSRPSVTDGATTILEDGEAVREMEARMDLLSAHTHRSSK